MENRNTPSNTIYAPLATRVFPLLTTFLFYKYKQYKMNNIFKNAVFEILAGNDQEKNLQVIKECIQNGVDPDYKMDKDQRTGLMLAANFSHKSLFNCLIQSGADVNSVDRIGLIPLYYLIDGLLNDENPAPFDADIFKYLLKHTNSDIQTIINKVPVTPLFSLCTIKNSNLIKCFIKHGLDVNKKDSLDRTPLMYAIVSKNIAAIKEFCHAGASINTTYYWGNTANNTIFHIAAIKKLPKEHIRALITHARFDSFNENQKEKERKILAVFSVLSTLPRDLRFFILDKLTLLDDDYGSSEKLCKRLFDMGYMNHITYHADIQTKIIYNILHTKNNNGKLALDLLYETQDNQYIQEVESLFNNAQLKNDIDDFINASINKSKFPENNLFGEIGCNYIRLLKENTFSSS